MAAGTRYRTTRAGVGVRFTALGAKVLIEKRHQFDSVLPLPAGQLIRRGMEGHFASMGRAGGFPR